MTRRRLIVVSNRGPVSFARENGERIVRRGAGGLATALRALVSQNDVTWVASAMTDEDRAVAAEHDDGSFEESGYRLRLVQHDADAYTLFYTVAANPTLWFVHHDLPGADVGERFRDAWANGYVPVNQGFARAVVDELERTPDAALFIHDYHLYLAPRMIRERCPDVRSSHFLHIPWPERGAWETLPADVRAAIVDGLLANDVVGFHTERWRRNFLATVGPSPARVTSHPIGIDPAEFDALATDPVVIERERGLAARRPEFLLLRVDRTDPAKNVVRGFEAFGRFLGRHADLQGRVRMLALLDPSRLDIRQYAEYRDAIEAAAAAVESAFPGSVELRIGDDFAQSVAAYKQYDALLVNSVFDGLNLVSKEGPYVNTRDGVLVLSRNVGSVEELGEWALTVDPFDVDGQAEAIHAAVTMAADERRRRAEALRAYVRSHDQNAWIAAQLADFEAPQTYDSPHGQ